jgi:hypothetical protein
MKVADEREAWENEILARHFANAGALGGGIGGAAGGGGAGLFGGRRGGARGARRAAGRMKNDVCELEFVLPMSAEEALEKVSDALSEKGELLETPYAAPGVPTVAAVTGSVWQNPTVVTVEIPRAHEGRSEVKIRAVAKISLLIRHTGEKVAHQVKDTLEAGSQK